jgi:hypothetical protein
VDEDISQLLERHESRIVKIICSLAEYLRLVTRAGNLPASSPCRFQSAAERTHPWGADLPPRAHPNYCSPPVHGLWFLDV